jgi:AI-2 transport protein TqsA
MDSAEEQSTLGKPADLLVGAGAAAPGNTLAPEHDASEARSENGRSQPWKDRVGLAMVAGCLIIAAAGWYLLKEFAPLLRPLLLAVFLCYIVLPSHRRLTRHISPVASLAVLAGVSVGLLVLFGLEILGSATRLSQDMPRLIGRAQAILHDAERYYHDHLPPWLAGEAEDVARGQAQTADRLKAAAAALAAAAADTLTEAVLVGIYLVFFLMEAGRVPRRIQSAFSGEQPERILAVVRNINDAMAGYLRVKVKASLVLAVPATVVLWAFGVEFALMWGVLTFLLNFIPYLGSIISCGAPILLAFLQMDSLGRPAVVAGLLISIHTLSAYVVEPAMTGKAVGLSPVVILVALSFWGLCWGLTGMLLAVPLTVMMKIILENVALTRPLARLMAED